MVGQTHIKLTVHHRDLGSPFNERLKCLLGGRLCTNHFLSVRLKEVSFTRTMYEITLLILLIVNNCLHQCIFITSSFDLAESDWCLTKLSYEAIQAIKLKRMTCWCLKNLKVWVWNNVCRQVLSDDFFSIKLSSSSDGRSFFGWSCFHW